MVCLYHFIFQLSIIISYVGNFSQNAFLRKNFHDYNFNSKKLFSAFSRLLNQSSIQTYEIFSLMKAFLKFFFEVLPLELVFFFLRGTLLLISALINKRWFQITIFWVAFPILMLWVYKRKHTFLQKIMHIILGTRFITCVNWSLSPSLAL